MFNPMQNRIALQKTFAALALLTLVCGSARAAPPVRVIVTSRGNGNANNNGRGPKIVPPGRGVPVVVTPAPRYVPPVKPIPVVVHSNGRYGRDGSMVIRAPGADQLDQTIAQVFIQRSEGLSCLELGDFLRTISNDILEAGALPDYETPEERRVNPGNRDEFLRVNRARSLKYMLKRPGFRQTLLTRLSDLYRSCNVPCFDDGVSIGVISGTGYCNAAVAVDGLPDAGFVAQNHLPMCQTANFVGCEQGYAQAVGSVQGCLSYATGAFEAAYSHQVSQDCHIDQ